MPTITSAASGNWSAAGTWDLARVPTAADDVIIASPHVVTQDNTSCVGLTIRVDDGGSLVASTVASNRLTLQNGGTIFGTHTVNMTGSASITSEVVLNNAGTTDDRRLGYRGTSIVTLSGFARRRKTTLLTAITTSGGASTTATVANATGWQIGDRIVFGTTQAYNATPRTDEVVLTAVNTGTGVISWTGSASFAHAIGGHVGNFTSNVVFRTPAQGGRAHVMNELSYSGTLNAKTFSNVLFQGMRNDDYESRATLSIRDQQRVSPNSLNITINDCPFYNNVTHGFGLGEVGSPFTFNRNIFYSTQMIDDYNAMQAAGTNSTGTTYSDFGIFRATGGFANGGIGGSDAGVTFNDGFVSGASGVGFTLVGTGTVARDLEIYSNNVGIRHNNGTIAGARVNVGTFNAANGSTTTNGSADTHGLIVSNTLTDSSSQTLALTDIGNCIAAHALTFVNLGGDVTVQEIYRPFMSIKRENTIKRRSTSSIAIGPTKLATPSQRTLSIPCAAGSSVRIVGYVQKSHATNVAATVAITGLGSSVSPFTKANDLNWQMYDLTATNSSGADGSFVLTYTATSSSGLPNVVYFDGVPDNPFVTKCRHYGFVFDEANPVRLVNPATQEAVEATALALSGITISGSTGLSPVALGANRTFQQVYDYSQAYACANLTFTPSFTATGLAGSPSLIALANVTTTGFTLDGGGSLAMGAFTLTANQPWPYTFTGGTFSQAAGVPTFAGGTLVLSSTGTRTLNKSAGQITFTAAGTYTMSAAALTSNVNLVNTSGGAVTVVLPAGQSFTNTGPNITVSSPVVTQGLAFAGLVAGSQVVVYTAGSTTELFRTNSSGTSETWSQAGGSDTTVDYTVMRAGRLPIRVTGLVVNSAVVTTPISQVVDRSYVASTGLTFGTTATVNTGTSRFTVTTATTVQNWYSFMIESWIAQSALRNRTFPISSNGPNSFTLEGWEFSSGINFLSRDGLRYTASGVATMIYAALYSVDTAAGLQIRYQQTDGGTTTNAATTGPIDQLIQVYGDASHGNFDRRSWLTLKVQEDGYDQAETNAIATYGNLEDQLYVIGLNPVSNGLPTGAPTVNGSPTITDHGASPVTWNSKAFSITITDSAAGNTGEALMRWIRYNLDLGGTFQGKPAFNWHDLVQTNGTSFKTVRGAVYGDTGAALKGVRVVMSDGTTPHPGFNLHTADDGTTFAPVFPAAATATVLADTRVQLFNVTTGLELNTSFVTGTGYSFVVSSGVTVGDTLRLRACKKGRAEAQSFAVWAPTGATFLLSQPVEPNYAAWGVDGATCTEYSLDGPNIQIDSNDVDGFTQKTRLGAFYSHALTTEVGIRTFFGAMTFLGPGSIRINADVVNLRIDNINATTALVFTDVNVRLFRSDGSSIIAPTSYTIHSDYNGEPFTVETGVSGLTGAESAQLLALPSASATADAVRTELAPELAAGLEVWRIHGLDAAAPLTVTPASRSAGSISQSISGNGTTSSTVTRA